MSDAGGTGMRSAVVLEDERPIIMKFPVELNLMISPLKFPKAGS